MAPLTTRSDFRLVISVCPDPAPLYTPSPEDLDVIFDPFSSHDDLAGVRTALFAPCLINFPRIVSDFFYPKTDDIPAETITQMWTFVDEFFAWLSQIVDVIVDDWRFNLESGRVEAVNNILFKVIEFQDVMVSVCCRCHYRVVGLTTLGKARKAFLGSSQARPHSALKTMDRFLSRHQVSPYIPYTFDLCRFSDLEINSSR